MCPVRVLHKGVHILKYCHDYEIFFSTDDRGVRDRERQGALIHFSTSQATEMTIHPRQEEVQTRPPNPRAEHVKTMGSGRGKCVAQ